MLELKKWEPFKDLSIVQREMDDMFRRFFGTFAPLNFLRKELKGEWYPVMDLYTKDNKFVVHADIPGVDPRDVDISVTGNLLTIKGERKSDIEEKKEGYMFHETSLGVFERTITLPEGVDTTNIHATYKNGVLEVTMPAKAEALPKKVKVELEEVTGKKAA
ncbi:MAG: Hsp20/alpha crystallin family protein [Deltaproteobacteria bacterium]|nr:Hsp20/alpha crystallin family protein [Deltaproteobacteria bacterium]